MLVVVTGLVAGRTALVVDGLVAVERAALVVVAGFEAESSVLVVDDFVAVERAVLVVDGRVVVERASGVACVLTASVALWARAAVVERVVDAVRR